MWAHQYNQEPNQVECSLHQKPWTTDGPESNLYGLEPNFGCCTANFSQGWPKFAASLFMLSGTSDADAGLVAAAYAPCEVNTVLRGVPIAILEETDYPFRGTVRFTVTPAAPLEFPLSLRIPGWAGNATIMVNNRPWTGSTLNGFAQIQRTWRPEDRVEIAFPMHTRVTRWFNDSIAIERGPLVFSYGIGEDWVKLRDRGLTADWQVFPATLWNYALEIDSANPANSVAIRENTIPASCCQPGRNVAESALRGAEESGPVGSATALPSQKSRSLFSRHNPPVTLQVKARRLPAWQADDGAANPIPVSPVAAERQQETLTLIPYAAAKLRITAFPQAKS